MGQKSYISSVSLHIPLFYCVDHTVDINKTYHRPISRLSWVLCRFPSFPLFNVIWSLLIQFWCAARLHALDLFPTTATYFCWYCYPTLWWRYVDLNIPCFSFENVSSKDRESKVCLCDALQSLSSICWHVSVFVTLRSWSSSFLLGKIW